MVHNERSEIRKSRTGIKGTSLGLLLAMGLSVATLVGCGNGAEVVEAISEEVTEDSEVLSEEPTEVTEATEEVSEPVSEEIVEVDYSADAIIAFIDELTVQYKYDDPNCVRTMVISANLDKIASEDLDTILANYGTTYEELEANYLTDLCSVGYSIMKTSKYYVGEADNLSPEDDYNNRITLTAVTLDEESKERAMLIDNSILLRANANNTMNDDNKLIELSGIEQENYYGEMGACYIGKIAFDQDYGNPYTAYTNTYSK